MKSYNKILTKWYVRLFIGLSIALLFVSAKEIMPVCRNLGQNCTIAYNIPENQNLNTVSLTLQQYFYFADLHIKTLQNSTSNAEKNDAPEVWYLGNICINEDNSIVERIYENTGGYTAIIQKSGNTYNVLTTTLNKEQKELFIKKNLEETCKISDHILGGKTYTVKNKLDNNWYYANYEPITKNNKIIGILLSVVEE